MLDRTLSNIESLISSFTIIEPSLLYYGTSGFRYSADRLKGVMITASHNLPCDNGLKLIDPSGDMLSPDWEPLVVDFVKCPESEVVLWLKNHLYLFQDNRVPCVLLGYDSRESSPGLADEVKQGIKAMSGVCLELGLVTTPQLHYAVQYMISMKLPQLESNELDALECSNKWATIDGDADRVLYFRSIKKINNNNNPDNKMCNGNERSIELFDGDRISCLFASFIVKTLQSIDDKPNLSIGVVQTAYANSASTDYMENKLYVTIVCVPTGVKYVHCAAHEFDFGIYFEANGHGTVLYSEKALGFMKTLDLNHPLRIFSDLTNTAIGDSVTDILMIEYTLAWLGWSLDDWAKTYTDLPSRQLKVHVQNPKIIQTTDAERRVVNPIELQNAIDRTVQDLNSNLNSPNVSRAFVRPSGTENIVRIFAESVTHELADWLANHIAIHIYDLVNGIGSKPVDPGPLPNWKTNMS